MSLYDAAIPILITAVAVILSFFDDRIIDCKVQQELPAAGGQSPFRAQLDRMEGEVAAALDNRIEPDLRARVLQILATARTELDALPAPLDADQRQRISQMCGGAATALGWFSSMVILLANAILAVQIMPAAWQRYGLAAVAVVVLLLVYHVAHVAVCVPLSHIADRIALFGLTVGKILRVELLILNVAIFLALAAAIIAAHSGSR